MTDGRLPAHLEAASLLRRAEASGGFGTVIVRGDRDSGMLLLFLVSRGVHVACLERQVGPTGLAWRRTGPGEGASAAEVAEWSQKRRRFDADCWQIELDVPSTERFIAETIAIG